MVRVLLAIALMGLCVPCFAQALSPGELAILKLLQGKDEVPNVGIIHQGPGYVGNGDEFVLNQIVDDNTALIKIGSTSYVTRGMSTKGLIDDGNYSFDRKLIAMVGTDSYVTVTGAKRTVGVVYIVDFSDVKRGIANINRDVRTREWPRVGLAKFVEMKDGKVTVESSGVKSEIAAADLKPEDREWIRKQVAAEAAQAKKFKMLHGF